MFSAVIEDSATRVADSQTDMIDRHLGDVNDLESDLESDLVALGREWVTIPTRDFADHFAMVRQINAEAAHFPQAALDAWQEAGPRRRRSSPTGGGLPRRLPTAREVIRWWARARVERTAC